MFCCCVIYFFIGLKTEKFSWICVIYIVTILTPQMYTRCAPMNSSSGINGSTCINSNISGTMGISGINGISGKIGSSGKM